LGTDLMKGKLTLPILLLRERASESERAKLEALIADWQPEKFPQLNALLALHGIPKESLEAISRQLDAARAAVKGVKTGHAELTRLVDFLARQTKTISA